MKKINSNSFIYFTDEFNNIYLKLRISDIKSIYYSHNAFYISFNNGSETIKIDNISQNTIELPGESTYKIGNKKFETIKKIFNLMKIHH